MKKKYKVLICISSILLLLFIICFIYLNTYYHSNNVDKYLKDNESVKVIKIKEGYYFDGKGTKRAIIFYPGAKVETESYAPLMMRLAENDIDCFLIDMPFRIAFLGINKADKIINNYKYENYTISGHSLGGVGATSYLIKNDKKLDLIIYFASYPNKKLPDNISMLSIYGENDKVLSMDAYKDAKSNWSKNSYEKVIKGGNHANFGNYGKQKKDGEPSITNEEQQEETVNYILEFIETIGG